MAAFDPALAKNLIRGMYDWQGAHGARETLGMVPDMVVEDPEEHYWASSKPPLSGWAVLEVLRATGDTSFAREMYHHVAAYHRWWYSWRDHQKDGLCEYGSTLEDLESAQRESGMHGAARFADSELVANTVEVHLGLPSLTAYSLTQHSVDLNSFLYAEKQALAQLAEAIHMPQAAETWRQAAARLKLAIQNTFFDEDTGYVPSDVPASVITRSNHATLTPSLHCCIVCLRPVGVVVSFFYDRYFNGSFVRIKGTALLRM